MLTQITQKSAEKLHCEKCDFTTSKKNDWIRHTMTLKHKNVDKCLQHPLENAPKKYQCECGNSYSYRQSLHIHKKKCFNNFNNNINNNINHNNENQIITFDDTPSENMIISKNANDINHLTSLVIEVVKNNSEFQKQMMDMCKNMQTTIISNNCNNTTNNTFNLQVFLNEHCKDAMNISEFIDSFDLQVSDLENVGRVGYIEGMSNIIINKIKELDVSKRPIHCSDLKREIIYIKDDDVWEREDANNTKFRKVIKKVAGKNIGMLNDWRDMYPECMDVESEYNDIYVKLTRTAMGPSDTEGTEAKIMKKILKHIVIDKKALV